MSSYSGWTLVFVDGAMTANFIRGPKESTMRTPSVSGGATFPPAAAQANGAAAFLRTADTLGRDTISA
jgi:hypothetical protein